MSLTARCILWVVCLTALAWLPTTVRAVDEDTAKAVAELQSRITRVNEGYETLRDERKRLIERGKKLQDAWREADTELSTYGAVASQLQTGLRIAIGNVRLERRVPTDPQDLRNPRSPPLSREEAGLIGMTRNANRQIAQQEISVMQQEVRRLNQLAGPVVKRINDLLIDLASVSEAYQTVSAKVVKEGWEYWYFVDLFGRRSRAELEAADILFSESIKNDHENFGALMARGGNCWRLGRTDAALRDLTHVIDADGPEASIALALRGLVRSGEGMSREGLSDFGQAAKRAPQDARINLLRALAFCGEEKFTSAIAELQKGLRHQGSEAEIYCVLSWVYCSLPSDKSAPKKALENSQRACTLTKSQDWFSLTALAAAQTAADDFPAAKETLDQAKKLDIVVGRERCQDYLDRCEAREPIRMEWRKLLHMKTK